MARYPFTTEANNFMKEIEPYIAKSTYKDKKRKLKLIAGIMDDLLNNGKIKTSNPRKVTVNDLIAYVTYRRQKGIAESTISKDLSLLNQFFIAVGNHCVEEFRVRAGNFKPHAYTGRKDEIPDETVHKVYDLARATDNWSLMEGLMLVVMTVSTGIRPQESRIFDIGGVHLMGDRSYIYIEHVKGEGKYGKPRLAPIMDNVEDIVEKYLDMRQQRLDSLGMESEAMFPNFGEPDKKYVSQQAFGNIKRRV